MEYRADDNYNCNSCCCTRRMASMSAGVGTFDSYLDTDCTDIRAEA